MQPNFSIYIPVQELETYNTISWRVISVQLDVITGPDYSQGVAAALCKVKPPRSQLLVFNYNIEISYQTSNYSQ